MGLNVIRLNDGVRLQMTLPSSLCSGMCRGVLAVSSKHSFSESAIPLRPTFVTAFPKFVTYVDKQRLLTPVDVVIDDSLV